MKKPIYPNLSRQHNILEFFMKMERTEHPEVIQIPKEIWEFLLGQRIRITSKHLPGNLNCNAYWESRHQKDSLESKYWEQTEIDLFISRSSNQLPSYYSWKLDPNCLDMDAFQQKWSYKSLYPFPFALIRNVLKKVGEEKPPSLMIVTPT